MQQQKSPVVFDHAIAHAFLVCCCPCSLVLVLQVAIHVDDEFNRLGTTVGEFTMLASRRLYVAGSPEPGELPGAKVKDNFRGCMRKVRKMSLRCGKDEILFPIFHGSIFSLIRNLRWKTGTFLSLGRFLSGSVCKQFPQILGKREAMNSAIFGYSSSDVTNKERRS